MMDKADMDKAREDLQRTIRETRKMASAANIPFGVRAFDEIGISDDMSGDGDGVQINLAIGMRDSLTKKDARLAAQAWRDLIARYPKASIYVCIAGYDTDSREIWEIPEAKAFMRRWARLVGLTDVPAILRSQLSPEVAGCIERCLDE